MEKSENYLRVLGTMFFANKRLVLFATLLVSVLATLAAFLYPPVYILEGSLIVKSKKIDPPPEGIKERVASRVTLPPTAEDVVSEMQVIASDDLIRSSVEKLYDQGESLSRVPSRLEDLIKNKIIEPVKQLIHSLGIRSADEEVSEIDRLSKEIAANLTTEILPGSNIIHIELLYDDPVLGAKILNAIFDNYLRFRLSIFTSKADNDFFSYQMARYKTQIEQLDREKLHLLKQLSITDVGNGIELQMHLIKTIREELNKLEDEYLEKQRSVDNLDQLFVRYMKGKDSVYQPFPHDFEDEEIRRFNERFAALLYGPKMRLTQAEIHDLWSKLIFLIRNKIQHQKDVLKILDERIGVKRSQLEALLARNQELKEAETKLDRIYTEIRLNKENYEIFSRKLEESKLEQRSEVTQMSNVQILSRASAPDQPYFPIPTLVIPIGILTGIILGISLGYVKEFFDHTFKTPEHVRRYLDLPVIGSIPFHEFKAGALSRQDKKRRLRPC